jgi:hypothetical protein
MFISTRQWLSIVVISFVASIISKGEAQNVSNPIGMSLGFGYGRMNLDYNFSEREADEIASRNIDAYNLEIGLFVREYEFFITFDFQFSSRHQIDLGSIQAYPIGEPDKLVTIDYAVYDQIFGLTMGTRFKLIGRLYSRIGAGIIWHSPKDKEYEAYVLGSYGQKLGGGPVEDDYWTWEIGLDYRLFDPLMIGVKRLASFSRFDEEIEAKIGNYACYYLTVTFILEF